MPTVTLEQLETLTWDRLDGNVEFFPKAQIDAAINEFIRVTNAFTGMIQGTLPVAGGTVANQVTYAVPQGILYPLKVLVNGVLLRRLSLEALGRNYRQWATDTTVKMGTIQRWAPVDIRTFILHPVDSIGGRPLSVLGVIEPAKLVNPSDVIPLEDSFVSMAAEYAASRVMLKEGGQVFANNSLFLQSYYATLKQRNALQITKMPRYWVETGPVK